MTRKELFEKNEKRIVKKATVCGLAIILIAVSLVPLVSSNGDSGSPEIEIIKTGPISGYVGDEIAYTYYVSNTGDVPLSNVNVNDDKCGLANYISGDENDNDELDTDEVWIFTSTYALSLTSPNPLVNTATASGEWEYLTVEDVDDWSVEVLPESEPEPDPEPEEPRKTKKGSGRSYLKNLHPVANAGGLYYRFIDEEIIFDGSGSYDSDGTIMHYGWSFGDGSNGLGEKVTHKYTREGSFVVELTIMDNFGAKDKDKTLAIIEVPNRSPSIPKILGPTNGSKDTKYSYTTGSTDLDNDDINYFIDWGDGTINESGFLPSGHYFSMLHSWNEPGEYTITATASDDQSTSSSEMTVLIEENIITDNIVIVALGILAIIVLLISLMYIKKGKKN
ncbi:MAG: PKD domain-containing protein [Thermoplasmatales archaeon]|nr:PKD domain-containing protein [Thermoplasmatales archaeon]